MEGEVCGVLLFVLLSVVIVACLHTDTTHARTHTRTVKDNGKLAPLKEESRQNYKVGVCVREKGRDELGPLKEG